MAETIIKKTKYTRPIMIKTPCKNIGPSPRATSQLMKKGKKKIPINKMTSRKYTKINEKKSLIVIPIFSIAIVSESPSAEKTHSSCITIKYLAYSKKNRVIISIMIKEIAMIDITVQLPSKRLYPHPKIYAT